MVARIKIVVARIKIVVARTKITDPIGKNQGREDENRGRDRKNYSSNAIANLCPFVNNRLTDPNNPVILSS